MLSPLFFLSVAALALAEDLPLAARPEVEPRWTASASAREEYRFRLVRAPDENEHLLRLSLDAGATSPSGELGCRGSLGLWQRFGEPSAPALASARDASWLDVYHLSADWSRERGAQRVRAGRLAAEYGPPAIFDGVAAAVRPTAPLSLFAFGGRSVHFFDLEQGFFEDWLASAGFELRQESWKLTADYRFLSEDVSTSVAAPRRAKTSLTNHSYGLEGWWRRDPLSARLELRGLGGSFARAGLGLLVESPDHRLGAELKVELQPTTLGELNEFDDPYFLVLGENKRHFKAHLDLFKTFVTGGGELALHAGGSARQLIAEAETPFNRNLLRGYVLASLSRIGGTGLFLSGTGELNRAGDGKGTAAASGALGWKARPFRAEAGTAWFQYRYVYYRAPEETADVRELYADARVALLSWLTLRARYAYEIADPVAHTFTVSLAEAR